VGQCWASGGGRCVGWLVMMLATCSMFRCVLFFWRDMLVGAIFFEYLYSVVFHSLRTVC